MPISLRFWDPRTEPFFGTRRDTRVYTRVRARRWSTVYVDMQLRNNLTICPVRVKYSITKIVQEARLVGEQFASNNAANGHAVTDAEKQREAMRYIKQRIEALNIQSDYAVLAGQLESEVRKAKETKS